MPRRTSQFQGADGLDDDDEKQEDDIELETVSSKDDDWVEDEPWGTRGYFRPTDRIVLNDTDPDLPPLPIITDPLKLINEALEV